MLLNKLGFIQYYICIHLLILVNNYAWRYFFLEAISGCLYELNYINFLVCADHLRGLVYFIIDDAQRGRQFVYQQDAGVTS